VNLKVRRNQALPVQPPVYFPFFSAVKNNDRELVYNELVLEENKYHIDFDDLEMMMMDGAKMLIFCSPHNPVGRAWSKKELEKLASLCIDYNVIVVSDEIHGDLVLPPNKHIPLATISEGIAELCISCFAPSKTFNLAGLATSSVVISNEELRDKFKKEEEKIHFRNNIFGAVASEAAYTNGGDWLDSALEYIQGNVDFVIDFFKEKMPEVKVIDIEATYLMWLDFTALGIPHKKLRSILIEKAGVGFNDGRIFGPGGAGFQRMNIACSREIIETALNKISDVFK